MISILLNWFYMAVLVAVYGYIFLQLYEKLTGKQSDFSLFQALFSGIMVLTCYAQIFSVFYRVALIANIVMVIVALLYCIWQRNYLARQWDNLRVWLGELKPRWRFFFLLLLVGATISFALCSSGPAKLIDTDWYHAQTIRWIEEYGCVKGVANLFYGLGFNNAQHYYDALFSMKSFIGQSLRGTGGFFGLLIFSHGLVRLLSYKKRTRHIADALACWEIAYSIIITAFYADPYTDTLPNMIVLFILTEWFSLLEIQNEEVNQYAFYCILGVFATVAKTSAVMIILLSIYPIYLLHRNKQDKKIVLYIAMCFCVGIPYLITNIITTGYPISLLNVASIPAFYWRIDSAVLQYEKANMIQFARMPLGTMEEALNCGLKWVPGWFSRESISHKLLYISILAFIFYDVIYTIKDSICCLKKKIQMTDFWMLLPRVAILLGIVYWFFTIPQVKYCWSYLIFPVAVIPLFYCEKNKKSLMARGMLVLSALLLVLYSGFYSLRTAKYMWEGLRKYPIYQADYENHVFDTVEKNGHRFYIRIDGGDIVCGYYIFPYLDNDEELNRLVVGEDLGDGFYFEP